MAKIDTNRNLVAALCYLPFFAVFLSIVILLVEKEDRFIRFNALQSVVISLGYFILNILVNIIFSGGILGVLGSILSPLLVLGALVVWVVSMIRAYQGQIIKWPFAGNFAEARVK